KLLRKQKTEIEQAQAELKVYADKLLQAKVEAEHHSKLKSQFLANMSHEIRTPMNSIIGFADILFKLIDNKQHRTFLEAIRNSGQSLLMLINDILDLSKIEADKMNIDNGPLNIRTLASEIKQLFSLQLREKKLNFTLQIDENLPDEVFLSEIRLRQILFNLIGNAIKFTDKGSIELRIFTAGSNNQKGLIDLHIVISDSGIGIEKEDQDRIFEAFYQHPSHAAKLKGTGLGLAITQRLVKAMNGSISLESQIGIGSVFTICFKDVKPIRLALETSDYLPSIINQEGDLSYAKTHKILLLTKNPVKHHLMHEIASQTGYEIILAEESHEFIELFGTHYPQCLIIDPAELINSLKEELFVIKREYNLQLIYIDEISPSRQQHYPDGAVFKLPGQQDLLKHFLTKLHNEIITKDVSVRQLIIQDNIELNPVFEEVHNLWLKALGSNIVSDAQLLAAECIKLADEKEIMELYHYGKSLEAAVENFDVEQISRLLRQFQNLKIIETSV
ncbi:MAG TPA: ATP-binding protein, partial [Bacteroidales bacterium]|nr:ATP-binding protein [Bacteroidales bacterium]